MIESLQKSASGLTKLKSSLESPDIDVVYLLCGNDRGGKYTLAHYLNGSDIAFEVDDDGYEVLDVQNPQQTISIVENLLQIIPSSENQKSAIFLKLQGFVSTSKTDQQNKQWCFVVDYVLKLLSQVKPKLKLVLVLSNQQLQEDDELLIKFKNSVSNVAKFQQRSHIVVSKLISNDQFDQFVEKTIQDIKQAKQECQYIDQIIQKSRIFPFFCHEIDESQRQNLIHDLMQTDVLQNFQLNQRGLLTQQILQSHFKQGKNQLKFHEQANKKLKNCLEIINLSLISIYFKGIKIAKDNKFSHLFKQLWQKTFLTTIQFEPNQNILIEENFQKFVHSYQALRNLQRNLKQLQTYFFKCFHLFQTFWPKKLVKEGIFILTQILSYICNGLSQVDNLQIKQILFDHEYGFLNENIMVKGLHVCRPHLSKQLIKYLEDILSTSPTKKKKKNPPKNVIPDYQQQKNSYKKKHNTLKQYLALLPSPLKIDLLMEWLKQKSNKRDTKNIKEEKQIIKNIIDLLIAYQCFKQAISFSWVLPDFLAMVNCIDLLIGSQVRTNFDITSQSSKLIQQVCSFFGQINKKQYIQDIIKIIEHGSEMIQSKTTNKTPKILEQLTIRLTKIIENHPKIQLQSLNKKLHSSFMNYERVQPLLSKINETVQKCINFEDNNRHKIQRYILQEWILKGKQLKIID